MKCCPNCGFDLRAPKKCRGCGVQLPNRRAVRCAPCRKIVINAYQREYQQKRRDAIGRSRLNAPGPDLAARTETMCAMYKDGKTLRDIGETFGLTRERVRQCISAQGVTRYDGGEHVASVKNAATLREAKKARRDTVTLFTHGCDHATLLALNGGKSKCRGLARSYSNQRHSAKQRGVEWRLTFPEWVRAWQESGRLPERGLSQFGFVMGRKLSMGPYSLDNIEIRTLATNSGVYYQREALADSSCRKFEPQ